jgi:hypothetical protein
LADVIAQAAPSHGVSHTEHDPRSGPDTPISWATPDPLKRVRNHCRVGILPPQVAGVGSGDDSQPGAEGGQDGQLGVIVAPGQTEESALDSEPVLLAERGGAPSGGDDCVDAVESEKGGLVDSPPLE